MVSRQDRPKIATFPRRVGTAEALVGINLQWEESAPVESLPWVNSLRVSSAIVPEDGAGEEAGAGISQPSHTDTQLGHELFAASQTPAAGAPVLVGSITTSVTAEWFVYSAEPCAEELAAAVGAQFPGLKIEARAQHDAGWSVFREFLLPSPLERHLIRNRRTLRELTDNGFDAGGLYTLDHTLWFSATDDRNAFAESLFAQNFELHYPEEDALNLDEVDLGPDGDDIEYGLTISREELLVYDAIDELVSRLFKSAASFGGEYEGWYARRD